MIPGGRYGTSAVKPRKTLVVGGDPHTERRRLHTKRASFGLSPAKRANSRIPCDVRTVEIGLQIVFITPRLLDGASNTHGLT